MSLAVIRAIVAITAFSGFSFASLVQPFHGIRHRTTHAPTDPCAAIANQTYVVPSKVLACLEYVPAVPLCLVSLICFQLLHF